MRIIFSRKLLLQAKLMIQVQIKILVVDDKPAIAKQLGEMFAKSDWLVESATDEVSALKACEHSGFSAIMISMALPEIRPLTYEEN